MLGNLLGGIVSGVTSLFGANKAQKEQEKQAELNRQMQLDFAQKGISWKVQDAKNAGIHPLYALGASTHSYAPVSVGDTTSGAFQSAGQSFGRAVHAVAGADERVSAVTKAASQLQLDNMALQNQLLASQIKRIQVQDNPAPPNPNTQWLLDGQGDTTIPNIPGTIIDKPMTRTGLDPNNPQGEVGANPAVGYYRTAHGYQPVPAKEVKERIEDIAPQEWHHYLVNNILPYFGINKAPPSGPPLPPGHTWSLSPLWGYYQRQLYNKKHREHFERR